MLVLVVLLVLVVVLVLAMVVVFSGGGGGGGGGGGARVPVKQGSPIMSSDLHSKLSFRHTRVFKSFELSHTD